MVRVAAQDKVRQAVDVLAQHSISQAPVVREDTDEVTAVVGSIQERALLERLFRDPDALQSEVSQVMGPPIPIVDHDAPVDLAFGELQRHPAVLVARGGRVLGILTRSDLLEFVAHERRD